MLPPDCGVSSVKTSTRLYASVISAHTAFDSPLSTVSSARLAPSVHYHFSRVTTRHELRFPQSGLLAIVTMDIIVAESSTLDAALLATDEEQYDKLASTLVGRLNRVPTQQLGSKDVLDV